MLAHWGAPRLRKWRSGDRTFGAVQSRFVELGQRSCEGPDPRVDVFGLYVRTSRQPRHDNSWPAEPSRFQVSRDGLWHRHRYPLCELEATPLQRCRVVTVAKYLDDHSAGGPVECDVVGIGGPASKQAVHARYTGAGRNRFGERLPTRVSR